MNVRTFIRIGPFLGLLWLINTEHGSEPPAGAEANKILSASLGDLVPTPTNMPDAYSKTGLIGAIKAAAKAGGISVKGVEIDDSEFPFLIGVVFAKKHEIERFKQEIRKMPQYKLHERRWRQLQLRHEYRSLQRFSEWVH